MYRWGAMCGRRVPTAMFSLLDGGFLPAVPVAFLGTRRSGEKTASEADADDKSHCLAHSKLVSDTYQSGDRRLVTDGSAVTQSGALMGRP